MIGNWIKFLLGSVLIMAIYSCTKNCAHVTCPANANLQCISGSCICNNGYEGDSCKTLSYVKFLGNWVDQDQCSDGTSGQYNVHIESLGGNKISISPVFNAGALQATIVNTPGNLGTTLDIPAQQVGSISVLSGSSGGYYTTYSTSLVPTIVLSLNFSNVAGPSSCTQTLSYN